MKRPEKRYNITKCGDAIEIMKEWHDRKIQVQTCVTSPPYWGLRDYKTDGQYGLEKTVEEYVNTMVRVFRAVKNILRDDGTLWLNLGDTIKGKQLQGIPWRVAFALQADGWYLRQDIIWSKPNPMPESITDRCTKAHEYVFLLAKSARYFYDAEAVKEPLAEASIGRAGRKHRLMNKTGVGTLGKQIVDGVDFTHAYAGLALGRNGKTGYDLESGTRNRRSVWHVATRPYSGAHFATFPPALITPCILAGTSAKGCCSKCGAPWKRVVERTPMGKALSSRTAEKHAQGLATQCGGAMTSPPQSRTTGWRPACTCGGSPVPCTVLDPFMGSGTVAGVSMKHGRKYLGCEINPDSIKLQTDRISKIMSMKDV